MAETLSTWLLTVKLATKKAASTTNVTMLKRCWLPSIATLIAAAFVPANWWALPAQSGQGDNRQRQLTTITAAQVNLPEGIEFGTIPLNAWVSSARVRMTPDELRGFTKAGDKNGTSTAWTAVADPKKLAELVVPRGGCDAGSYLLGPIKIGQKDDKSAQAARQPIENIRSISAESEKSFCFLTEKPVSDPPVISPPKVVFLEGWRKPITPPPIVVRAPDIRIDGDWPIVRLPDIVVHPPKITPTDAWPTPQTLPPVPVDPPKVTPTDAWSKAQPLPSFIVDPPIVEPTPEWKKAQPLPPVLVGAGAPNGLFSRSWLRLGAVYFKLACPQVAEGARCDGANGIAVSEKERPEPIGPAMLTAQAAEILKENSLVLLFVVGSADPIGEDKYNTELSTARASWLRDQILKQACGTDEICKTQKKRRVVTHAAGEMPTPPQIPVQPQHRRADVFVYVPVATMDR